MKKLFGPREIFLSTDTRQAKDYSKYNMDNIDTTAKEKQHENIFPKDLEKAFQLGSRLAA